MTRKTVKKPSETQGIQKRVKNKSSLNIKYNITLNDEQKEAKRKILANPITVITGKAGSGKTQLAILTALDLLFKGEIKKIFITRPLVTREDMGFLPGDIKEKLEPILLPIYDCLNNATDKQKIEQAFFDKEIEIAPIAFMRGRTIENAMLIIDEAQNVDDESMKMCLTRIGKNGKIVICGDVGQIDLKNKNLSGLYFLASLDGKVTGLNVCELKANHRHSIIEELLNHYDARDAEVQALRMLNQVSRKIA
ncbi:MAG: PhoH family protein [Bacteroidia bacterium]